MKYLWTQDLCYTFCRPFESGDSCPEFLGSYFINDFFLFVSVCVYVFLCVCFLLQVRDATAQDADSQWTQRDGTGPSRVQWTT